MSKCEDCKWYIHSDADMYVNCENEDITDAEIDMFYTNRQGGCPYFVRKIEEVRNEKV